MEAEAEGRVKSLPYKVRSVSRESAAQKATQVLDPDLRTHWSTSTNAKEWLVLELEESCLLSHIRIHNKSVLEWEISIGLRFKPDTYLKVRPRCEAPRRDVTYHVGYQPCCFVRISCLRGNPIAIFHIQLMGIPVPGLEPELQPVVDYVLPHVIAHVRDPHDIYIQLLQEIAVGLSPFLSHLEGELGAGTDAMESSMRYFAMLIGPYYPILTALGGRENDKVAATGPDFEAARSNQATVFTVSSNFQAPPKRVRSPGISQQTTGHELALRPESVFLLLKTAFKNNYLGRLCRKVSRLLRKLRGSVENLPSAGESPATTGGTIGSGIVEVPRTSATAALMSDYSSIFGEDYKTLEDDGIEINLAAILNTASVEESLLHLLYACVSQPMTSWRLADIKSDLVPVLPVMQAMIPVLCPLPSTSADASRVDETFWQWQAPSVQRAVAQVVALSTSPSYRPLLDACAGYLGSYSQAHEKAACVLIDLCSGPLAPWLPMVVAKIDLTIELLEDLLGVIQADHGVAGHGRACLVYLILALSGHVDGVLAQYKDVKYNILFLIEILEPFLIPAISPLKSTIAFGDVSAALDGKQEQSCTLALDFLYIAIQKPAVLPAMESEWRRGHVTPSVLLSILAPHIQQPPGIELRRAVGGTDVITRMGQLNRPRSNEVEVPNKEDAAAHGNPKVETGEDPNLLFAPLEMRNMTLPSLTSQFEGTPPDAQKHTGGGPKADGQTDDVKDSASARKQLVLDPSNADEYFNLQAEFLQLVNLQERELRAMEFVRFATELHTRNDPSEETHEAAIDALLLAAECHLNPFFMTPSSEYHQQVARFGNMFDPSSLTKGAENGNEVPITTKKNRQDEFWLEEERDKAVLRILLEAADWDKNEKFSGEGVESEENLRISSTVQIFEEDSQAEDALTRIREHQDLLCTFFARQLKRARHSTYEVLLQGLLLILDSATRLSIPPAEVVEIILGCALRLNYSLLAYDKQMKEGTVPHEAAGVDGIRRQWALLRRLVLVASGGRLPKQDYGLSISAGGLLHTSLIPFQAWMAQFSKFAYSEFPLVRYVGWMALSRYATYYKDNGLVLVSDVHDLTGLLLIFSDVLYSVAGWNSKKRREGDVLTEAAYGIAVGAREKVDGNTIADQTEHFDPGGLIKALYPALDRTFPGFRLQFSEFANVILESVCHLVKGLPSSGIPDLLSWFSEICIEPFSKPVQGYAIANVKYVILNVLEVIAVEHMDAIVPELPRVLRVLLSLCSSTYSDVPLMESVLTLLKPVISHAAAKAAAIEAYVQDDNPGMSFESLCFDALVDELRSGPGKNDQHSGGSKGALVLFLAGYVLSDLSAGRRNEFIASFSLWANFTQRNSATSHYNFLRAFQKILAECSILLKMLAGTTDEVTPGEIPAAPKPATQALFALTAASSIPRTPGNRRTPLSLEGGSDIEESETERRAVDEEGGAGSGDGQDDPTSSEAVTDRTAEDEQVSVDEDSTSLDVEVILHPFGSSDTRKEFKEKCAQLLEALGPALESCWKIHPQLTSDVAHLGAMCLFYSGFQMDAVSNSSNAHEESTDGSSRGTDGLQTTSDPRAVSQAVEFLSTEILRIQQVHCWQLAAVYMDYLLSLLTASTSSQALNLICSILQYQCNHAPRVAWRLQTSKWLLKALSSATPTLSSSSAPLTDLLCIMLDHSEPEQRLGALNQLRKLITDELEHPLDFGRDELLSTGSHQDSDIPTLSRTLANATWEKVAMTAARDPLLGLRKEAMELLLRFVPLADLAQLQSFLKSSFSVLPTSSGMTDHSGPLTRLALMVLSRSCLYVPQEDVSIIPDGVWDSIHFMANARTGGLFAQPERALCRALLQLREHGETAKEPMMHALSGGMEKLPVNSAVAPVREAVLEVLARFSAVCHERDSAISAAEKLTKEVEEAEIELELASQERFTTDAEAVQDLHGRNMSSKLTESSGDPEERLKQLRRQILDEERKNVRSAIAARREKKRLARHERQLAVEKAAFREVELIKSLDRERVAEAEREIERQRALEKERAKTREMRFMLEVEAERRSQRDIQRELEQRESGVVRSSRRGEISSSTTTPSSSRPRERYRERERESGRVVHEGSSRSSAGGGSGSRESVATPPATPTGTGTPVAGSSSSAAAVSSIAVTGTSSRSQTAGFLQAGRDRDRERDDRSGGYDDCGVEGNGITRGEAGDGDPEGGGSGVDGGSFGVLAGGQRQSGARTSRPRQIVERRERDTRREGKWERKQT